MKKIVTIIMSCILMLMPFSAYAEEQSFDQSQAGRSNVSSSVDSANDTVVVKGAANYYRFFKTKESVDKTGAKVLKVSADVIGPGTITSTVSKTTSATYSSTLASNNNGLIRGTISGSYGISLQNSLGYSLNIASGKTGYLAFQPYRIVVKGNLKYYTSLHPNTPLSSTAVTAKFPKKLSNGFADGKFYIKYTK